MALGVVSATFNSCRPSFRIADITISARFDMWTNSGLPRFHIQLHQNRVNQVASAVQNVNLIPKAYALRVCETVLNGLVFSSFSMSFDRDILFDSEIIDSGTDIFQLESLKNYILVEWVFCCHPFYIIRFYREIENRLVFESGEYTVYFSCETTDGLKFNVSTTMTIR